MLRYPPRRLTNPASRRLTTLGLVLVLMASVALAVAGSARAATAVRPAGSAHAQRVLAHAQRLFDAVPAKHPTRSATLVLRNLALSRSQLTGDDRAAADALLARPTDGGSAAGDVHYTVPEAKPDCSPTICIHYVTSTADAPDPTDVSPANGIPDFVDSALSVVQHVHDTYLAAGYRSPEPDGTRGGDARIDVYLADIGGDGLYGYCTSDEPDSLNPDYYDRWAYCVYDNDFSATQFPSHTPLENLEVTAAHEYFHATQFAYDIAEDSWLLEATAAWAEDIVYTDVNDNRQYLAASPLTEPQRPLDTFADDGFHYGVWTFFRYLTERYPASSGGMPTLVRRIFELADGARGGPDQYSWQAVDSALHEVGSSAAAQFTAYSAANRRSHTTYAEGAAGAYPVAPLAGSATLKPSHTSAGFRGRLDHLSSATVRFTPSGTSNKKWRLRFGTTLGSTTRALATVVNRSGSVSVVPVGNGTTVPFSTSQVRYVELTVANTGGHYRCFDGGAYSCQGDSLDDAQAESFGATAYRTK